jgi:pyruvate ferredoxin oxidoreductase delta subunit
MKRPKIVAFQAPVDIDDYPLGPTFTAGHLVESNAGWRTFKPIFSSDQCIGCHLCFVFCPEGVIFKTDNGKVDVDYDFCKGCGICAKECKVNAITMIKEVL